MAPTPKPAAPPSQGDSAPPLHAGPAPPPAALHIDDDWEGRALEFPVIPLTPTYTYIPKQLQRRYAAIRNKILDYAMDAELSQPSLPPQRIQAWSTLARLIPFLLLYNPGDSALPTDPSQPTSVRKELTRRMLLAEQGQYGALLEQGMLASQATHTHRNAAPIKPRSRTEVLAAACDKAEDGSLRSAAQLLIGDATLPPTHTTAAAVEKLYSLQPKTPLPQPGRMPPAVTFGLP